MGAVRAAVRLGLPAWIALAAAAIAASGPIPADRTLFLDIPPNDPVREIVQTVLDSRFLSMRGIIPRGEWTAGGYGDAWKRVRRYFPGKTYYVVPGTYFMTHGFDPDGRLFMEIHESAYLALCVENRETFAPEAILGAFGRMREAADGRGAASFREKLGRLENYFGDEAALRGLRKSLGDEPFRALLKDLREEDYHMIAGGLMHEGVHAGLDDAVVARLQAEFGAGQRPVQWDELRAFMAEIGYHSAYVRWAAADVDGSWKNIERLLADLEGLRKMPRLGAGAEKARFDRVRARAWAAAVLVRLRMREIWQSARRMQDLAEGFRRDYVGSAPPADIEDLITRLEKDAGRYVAEAGEAIQAGGFAAASLDDVLDTWSEWAEGRRPFPPPVTDSRAVLDQAKAARWPAPPAGTAAALMKKADEALAKERAASSAGRPSPTFSQRPDSGPASWAG
jgi:hypothetical protein